MDNMHLIKLIKQKASIIEDPDVVYLKFVGDENISRKYRDNVFSRVKLKYSDNPNIPNIYDIPTHYITTSKDVIIENGWEKDLENQVLEPNEYHPKRLSIRFICDTQVARDLWGEKRNFIITENDNVSNEYIELIPPYHLGIKDGITLEEWDKERLNLPREIRNSDKKIEDQTRFIFSINSSLVDIYDNLIYCGWTERAARSILPICLKTEITMTGFEDSWKKLFSKTFSNPQTNALLKSVSVKL